MKAVKAVTLILIALVVGCTSIQLKDTANHNTPEKMTAAGRGVLVTSLYNNAFTNYNLQFEATPKPMSPDMRDYFQAYKKAMENAYPVIAAYNSIVQIGGVPSPEQEAQIIQMIYQLQAMLMTRKG